MDTQSNIKSKKVAIYCRVGHRNDLEMARQKKDLLSFAKEQGYVATKVYEDNGFSGLTLDRPALKRLVKDILQNGIKTIIVRDVSSFGVDTIKTMKWLWNLAEQDIEVETPDNPNLMDSLTPNKDFLLAMSFGGGDGE